LKIVWSPKARIRALAAVEYIAEERPSVAVNWFDALVDRIELLKDLPEQGRVVPEWGEPQVREVIHSPYRIIYEVFPDRVEILTLSHERQILHPRGTSEPG
jgi:toxin ParE1/3/4